MSERIDEAGSMTGGRRRLTVLTLACGAVILIPYATIPLPSLRLTQVAQAVAILAVVIAIVVLALLRQGWGRRLLAIPVAPRLALALWVGATLLGIGGALARRNELAPLAGQVLALGLMPLAALAATAFGEGSPARAMATGIIGATTLACAVHFAFLARSLAQRQTVLRLFLPNDVAPVGVVMLAMLLVLALATARSGRRLMAFAALAAMAFYVFGSGVRSLWLVAPATLGLFVIASGTYRLLRRRRVGLAVAGGVAAVLGIVLGFNAWITWDRPTLLPGPLFAAPFWRVPAGDWIGIVTDPEHAGQAALRWTRGPFGERPIQVTDALPVEPDTAYLLAVELRGEGHRGGRVFVMWGDEHGVWNENLGYLLQNAEPGRGRQRLVQVAISPKGARTAYVALGLRNAATSAWTLYDLRLRRLGSPMLAVVFAQATYMGQRIGSLAGLADPTGQNLEGFTERFGETRLLLEQIRDAPLLRKLLGAGLGARYPMKLRNGQDAHYIHNFYVFLLYKLGIVGTAMVLSAMSLWIGFTLVAARRARDSWGRAFLWAAFSAWIGYAVWSLACPEILNFRMAPLWGFLIAATVQTDREERGAQPEQGARNTLAP